MTAQASQSLNNDPTMVDVGAEPAIKTVVSQATSSPEGAVIGANPPRLLVPLTAGRS